MPLLSLRQHRPSDSLAVPSPCATSSPFAPSSFFPSSSRSSLPRRSPPTRRAQMFIGDGAKLVRDCFALAKEKAPAIVFIDEIDAIGTKRFDSDKNGDREVQRTMLELLNQLDGFGSDERIKVRFSGARRSKGGRPPS